jgi:hypothetical protein
MPLEKRDELFQAYKKRLQELAHRAIFIKQLKPKDFLMICIDVDDDPDFRDLADHLMPNHNWQKYRDRGEKPIAMGSVMIEEMREVLSLMVPAIKDALYDKTPKGVVLGVVLGSGGASVYYIEPVSELQHNYRNN